MHDDWRENGNGNWVLPGDEGIEATVYAAGSEWGAVWNGASDGKARRLKGKYPSSQETIAATEAAITLKWWGPDDQWLPNRTGGYYRRHNGMVVSVKRTKRGSWFVTNGSASLGRYGQTTWFATDVEARSAFDVFARGGLDWQWIARRDAG
jgi:hypothetical protein